MDMTLLLCLAVGLKFGGKLSDIYNPKKTLLLGMIISTVFAIITGILRVAGNTNLGLYCFTFGSIGFFEAAIPPALLKILSNWFS